MPHRSREIAYSDVTIFGRGGMTTLSYNKAVMAMHKPDARLIQTNGVTGTVRGIIPCGHAVAESVAAKIIARPAVEGSKDSLFPHMGRTWRLRRSSPR
jgi:hypothetical protein